MATSLPLGSVVWFILDSLAAVGWARPIDLAIVASLSPVLSLASICDPSL